MTQEIVNKIRTEIGGFTYRGGETKFLGDCRIDVWDILTGEDLFGAKYKIPVMELTHEVDGGLTTTVKAMTAGEEDTEDSFKGPNTKAMERTHAQLMLVNKLVATKASIEYLEANYIKTSELDAVSAEIENAVITNLQGKYASIEYLQTNYATIENLGAANAKIDTLEVNALTSNSAVIQSLQSGVADINTLMFGSAAGGTIQTEFSNSIIASLGDAQIKSAMIKDISADKLTSGKIYTNQVEIVSRTGNLDIADNTIQIKDGKKVVRVQIGKDASGDYNIYIWDKNGKLMFDPLYGVQEDGIKKAIIRNDMISDTANISGKKIDIASLITTINEDGSSTLKASKIYVDTDKQTLDISFKNMSTTVSEVTTTASSALTTAQGANSTASSALSAASAAARTANTANSTANTAKTTANTAKNTADSASANATSALNKVTTLTETVTTQGTQITTIQGQISSKIWQQDITTAVSNVQVGGRNLCLNSAKHDFAKYKTAGTTTTTLVADGDALSRYHTEIKTTSTAANFYSRPYKECQTGKTYTWSFWGKASITKSGAIGCERGGQKAVSFTTEWQKYTHTFTANNSQYSAFTFYLGWKNGEILYIRDFKFEEGTKATTWTPAPEDVDSAIETVNTTLATKYSNLEQSLSGFKTTVSETYATKTTVDNNLATSKSYADTVGSNTLASAKTDTDNKLKSYATTAAMTSAINQKADSITSTVSATYATKTEMSSKKNVQYAYFDGGGKSAGYCFLAQIKIRQAYINTDIIIGIDQRNRGLSEIYIQFANGNTTDPALGRIRKTGTPRWFIVKSTTSTWNLYVQKSESWDRISVTEYYNPFGSNLTVTWMCQNANAVSGWTEAKQLAALYGVDSTDGGTSGSDNLITSKAVYSTTTIAKQTAEQFKWIVKSGTSATDFTITDRLASLTAQYINLNGLVTFNGLNSSVQTTLSKAQGIADNIYTAGTTTINGGKITTGSIAADKIKVDSLQAICAKIGGFTIDSNSIYNGTWGNSGSVMMCTGSSTAKSIGGSANINGWCFTAGDKFGVTKAGALYATSGKVGNWNIDSVSLYSDKVTSDGYLRRVYLQTLNSTNPDETWAFSVQKGATSGESPSKLNAMWYVTGNGDMYSNNITAAGNYLNVYHNLTIGGAGAWVGYALHCHGNAYVDGKISLSGDVECKNLVLGKGAYTNTYVTADAYGSTSFIVNSSARHVIGEKTDTFYNQAAFSGNTYPQIYGNGTYLLFGYGNSQAVQLDNSKRFMPVADNTYYLGYSGYRWKQVYAAAGSISTSDRNQKKDIQELDTKAYDFIMGLKPVKYKFIENDSDRKHWGLVAQDVEQLMAQIGITSKDFAGFIKSPKIKVINEKTREEMVIPNEYDYGLRYEEFIAPLIKTVQMQEKKIQYLESMVTHLIGIAMHPEKIDYNNN